ncbi:MAG TPA: RidA family protein [Terriglobia bacterium]|nr:RidA family protein [Terriglobia bacterium]
MISTIHSTRRKFGVTIATLLSGLGFAGAASKASAAGSPDNQDVQKLNEEGKPATGTPLFFPIVAHNGLIYISGQGAHDERPPEQWDITSHSKQVLDRIKNLVEKGGSTMDRVLQLNVYLGKISDYDGMNKVFKTYFPNGGPARTTVAVANLPGNSLVEINCIAAVSGK